MRIIKGDVEDKNTLDLIMCEMVNLETNTYHFDTANASIDLAKKPIKGYPSYRYDNQIFTVNAKVGFIFIPIDVSIVKLLKRIHEEYPGVIEKFIPGYSGKLPIESVVEYNESVDVMKRKKITTRGFTCQGNIINGIRYNSVIVSDKYYSENSKYINAKFVWVIGTSKKFTSADTDCLLASILVDTYDSSIYKHCQLVSQFDMSCVKPINKANFDISLSAKIHPALFELECSITGASIKPTHMSQTIKCNRVENLTALGINVMLPDVCENCHLPFIGDVIVPMTRRGETSYKFLCQKCICCNKSRLNNNAYDYYIIKAKQSIGNLIDQYVVDEDKRNILYHVGNLTEPECDPRFGYYYRILHGEKKYLLVNDIELFMLSGKAPQFADYLIVNYEVLSYY